MGLIYTEIKKGGREGRGKHDGGLVNPELFGADWRSSLVRARKDSDFAGAHGTRTWPSLLAVILLISLGNVVICFARLMKVLKKESDVATSLTRKMHLWCQRRQHGSKQTRLVKNTAVLMISFMT